jgi:hypothetical protein
MGMSCKPVPQTVPLRTPATWLLGGMDYDEIRTRKRYFIMGASV